MTTTRDRPSPDNPEPDSDRTLVDGSPEDRWNNETEARPATSADSSKAGGLTVPSVNVSGALENLPEEPKPSVPGGDPESIGPYRIERRLGAGGMGTVFLGRHVETDDLAAVKVLAASMAREPEIIERFSREIDAMQKLSGPHIVSLYDSGTDEESGQVYFAMEFVDGQTLGEMLRDRRRLTWGETVDIALQICTALKAAHAAGIVHRDLKPSNLLIGHDGLVHLTDFGVAQVFASQRLTVTGGIIGTAEFMSPEQAEGRRCTKKSDLYSLGAVIYAMLTGRPPFTGQSSLDILRQHLTGRFDRPSLYAPDTPRQLDELVCKLLEKKPDDRHPDTHIVSLRLRAVVRRVELASETETPFKRELHGNDLVALTAPGRPGSTGAEVDRPAEPRGPGPATLMRNALKSELARAQEPTPLARFFDQTWVLVTCLALLIGGGVWWVQAMRPGTDTDTEASPVQDDVSRFLRLAASYRRLGDRAREEDILRSLRIVIQHDPDRKVELARIDRRLEDIHAAQTQESRFPTLDQQGLDQATRLIESGETEAARTLLYALLRLYQDDPSARPVVAEILGRLKGLESTGKPSIE